MARTILKISPNINKYDAIIIGAGAAGLFCAQKIGQYGKKVLIIEHNAKVGAKILISGGGRCNFTNLDVTAKNFICQNPHFAKSALSTFTNQNFIEIINNYKIPYYEKTLGQLFVDKNGGAKDIINMLEDLCKKSRVKIKTETEILNIIKNDEFEIETSNGNYFAKNLIIATGGKSISKLGATSFAYEIAKKFDINIIEPKPALVPLMLTGKKYEWLKDLAGVSLSAIVKYGKIAFEEGILFTHRGLSGPAILQISNYIDAGSEIHIDFVKDDDFAQKLISAKQKKPNQNFVKLISSFIPDRLAKTLCEKHDMDKIMQNLKNQEIIDFAHLLREYPFTIAGDEGFVKAEVTKFGIDTNEINQKTFETKKQEGLYFIGECLDVTGQLGGYNFQWAWSSAYCAGQAIGEKTQIL